MIQDAFVYVTEQHYVSIFFIRLWSDFKHCSDILLHRQEQGQFNNQKGQSW